MSKELTRTEALVTILCVGEDPNLLAYRALILKRAGASVKLISGAAAPKLIEREEFTLIVVGHTVRDESARTVFEAAKAQEPSPVVLRLRPSMGGPESEAERYSDAVSNTDPAILVRNVRELLEQRKSTAYLEHGDEKQRLRELQAHRMVSAYLRHAGLNIEEMPSDEEIDTEVRRMLVLAVRRKLHS